MTAFKPLFRDWRTGFYSIALALVLVTLFAVRIQPTWSLNTVAILLLLVAWIVEGGFSYKLGFLRNRWIWAPLFLFIAYALGVTYSENQDLAFSLLERKLSLVLAPLLTVGSKSLRKEHLCWSVFVFVLGAVAATLSAYALAVYQGLLMEETPSWIDLLTYDRLATAISMQPIYLSFFLVFAFYGVLALFISERFADQFFYKRPWRTYPVMAFLFVAIIMLSSRMEILVLFATGGALIITFLPSNQSKKRYLAILTGALLVAATIVLSSADNRQRFKEMFDLTGDYTEDQYGGRSIRLHKWKNTLECWSDNPIIGVGPGDMQKELNLTYARNNFDLALQHQFNPHNQYLETLLSLGIPGFALLAVWFWSLCWWGWRHRNWLLFAFGMIVSLSVITESMLERQWGVVFIAFFSALFLTDNFKYFRVDSNSNTES